MALLRACHLDDRGLPLTGRPTGCGRFHFCHSSERIECSVEGFFRGTSLPMPLENLGLDRPITGLSFWASLWIFANELLPATHSSDSMTFTGTLHQFSSEVLSLAILMSLGNSFCRYATAVVDSVDLVKLRIKLKALICVPDAL